MSPLDDLSSGGSGGGAAGGSGGDGGAGGDGGGGGGGAGGDGAAGGGGTGGATSAYVEEVLADGPLLYMRFEETTPPLTYSEDGQSFGVCSGCVLDVASATPALGRAIDTTDGGVDIDMSATATDYDFTGTAPFTIEAWVKPTVGAEAVDARIVNKRAGIDGYELLLSLDPVVGGGPHLGLVRWATSSDQTLQYTGYPAPGEFSHVVAVFDGAESRLYVNKIPGASSAASLSLIHADSPLSIGHHSTGGYRFPGVIDEVAIYPQALSLPRIVAHYDAAFR